jgi:hypothetical protein
MSEREPYGPSEEFPAELPGQQALPEYAEPAVEGTTADTPESLGLGPDEPGDWAGDDARAHHPHDAAHPATPDEMEG